MINTTKNSSESTATTPVTTGRKNRTKSPVKWPTGFFSYNDLFALNSDAPQITIRSKTVTAISAGKVVDLGVLHKPKGRPVNIFALSPVSNDTIESARKADVMLKNEYVKVADINTTGSEAIDVAVNVTNETHSTVM